MTELVSSDVLLGAGVSQPFPLGLRRTADGQVNAAIWAPQHEQILLHWREPGGNWQAMALPEYFEGVHHGVLDSLPEGSQYCYFNTEADPETEQLWLDPYAPAVAGIDEYNAGGMLRSVFLDQGFDWGSDAPPRTGLRDSIIYELHVKGFSKLNELLPEELRGTYAGLAHPESVAYLSALGVSAVELLPVHAHLDEAHLRQLGLPNYWGYNSINFFSPHPGYATAAAQAAGPKAVQDEFKGMVKLLHAAGIEVILDVVFNHTAEGPASAPALSWRGLAPNQYYRIGADGEYEDTTGCGNSLDFSTPRVVQMALDSLRHWVQEFHIDGFRFDLAVTLGRDAQNTFTPAHPFLVAATTSAALAGVKLISEPWDVGYGGWQTGNFPTGFSDWNDSFRDAVRSFWLSDAGTLAAGETPAGMAALADALFGNASLFAGSGRGPLAAVNFVTAHDGLTLADLCAHNSKHNEANGEDNADGTSDNRSYNHGVEGPTDSADVNAARAQCARNVLATLLFSFGVPMLTAGDEIGRSQRGNNNAYCQDNELSWIDWARADSQMLAATKRLIRLRKDFLSAQPSNYPAKDQAAHVNWFADDGAPMEGQQWQDGTDRVLQVLLGSPHGALDALVVFNAGATAREVTLPASRADKRPGQVFYEQRLSTGDDHAQTQGRQVAGGQQVALGANTVTIFKVSSEDAA